MGVIRWALILLALAALALIASNGGRNWLRGLKQEIEFRQFLQGLDGVRRESLAIAMPDGVRLATDLYLPETVDGPVPAILIRLPYGKTRFGEVRHWLRLLAPQGYAVVVQDMRGRHASQGVFAPYPNAGGDGAATLDWIADQGWSDGRVGTVGCSALGEHQFMLAARRHPAHRAMIPLGAGGAIGTAEGAYGFFGFFDGGVFTLASGFGWFAGSGGKTPDRMGKPAIDYASALRHLPLRDAVARVRADPTDFEALLDGFDDPAFHAASGFVRDADSFATPALIVDSWYDGPGDALALWRKLRRDVPDARIILGPGLHCDLTGPFDSGRVGDVAVDPAAAPDFDALFLGWLDHKLRDAPPPDGPPVLFYILGADRWATAESWPPANSIPTVLHLADDRLSASPDPAPRGFLSDPGDPVPTLGGAICCTGDPDARAGPLDQSTLESRDDLLIYTSDPLAAPLTLAGPVTAEITVSAEVPDADLVLRLTDVDEAGRSILIQEGALRLRYRDGFDRQALMTPGTRHDVTVSLKDIAWQVPEGHRLRLHVAGSSFPRLARNMQGGGRDPYAETAPKPGRITIHGGRLRLTTLPD